MSIGAGKRTDLITFQRATVRKDGFGGEVKDWVDQGTEWAAVSYGTGEERRTASQVVGSLAATFSVPDNVLTRSLSITDRISFDGSWDIKSNVPSRAMRDGRDITAVRRAN
jgi:hypothetical protein